MQFLKCMFVTYIVTFIFHKMQISINETVEKKVKEEIKKGNDKKKTQRRVDSIILFNGLVLFFTTTIIFYILGSFILW